MKKPFKIFEDWYASQLEISSAKLPSACCFTTIGEDDYPNSRFVSLKEVKNEAFIITGPINSRKGLDIKHSPKVSIAFWWPETAKQIRIQGIAEQISLLEAKAYFTKRHRASQIVSSIFDQGEEIESFDELSARFEEGKLDYDNKEIDKPQYWSGFSIKPKRIEFMEFMESRLHRRIHFEAKPAGWEKTYLQP